MIRYELDSAEQIMCDLYDTDLVSTPTNVIEMNHDVLEDGLYYAARQAMKQHPYFATKMIKDGLTVYMEENDLPFVIKKAGLNELPTFGDASNNYYSWRVFYEGNKIYTDFSHYMTDGGGTLYFLADFLEHYIDYYEGKLGEAQVDAVAIADEVRLASDVAFTQGARPDDFLKAKEITPFKEGLFKDTPSQECVTISVPVAEIKALCKAYDVSPFAVIAVFLSRACLKIIDEQDTTPAVGLMVPVECRRMFETHTFHNFTSIAFIYCENEDLRSASPSAAAQSFRYQLLQQSEKEDMAYSYTRYHDLRPLLADPEQRETIIKVINSVVHNKTHVTYTHLTHPLYSERVGGYVVSNYCAVCALPQLAYIICAGLTDNENYNLSIPDNMTTSDFFDELFAILDEFGLHYSVKRIPCTYPHLAKFAE